jgi:hypothetical protein
VKAAAAEYAHLANTPLRRDADEIGRQIASRLAASKSACFIARRKREKAEM